MENININEYKRILRKIQNDLKTIRYNANLKKETYNNNPTDTKERNRNINSITFFNLLLNFSFIGYTYTLCNNPFITLPFFYCMTRVISNYISQKEKIQREEIELDYLNKIISDYDKGILKIEDMIGFLNKLTDEEFEIFKKVFRYKEYEITKYLEELQDDEKTKYLGY